VLVVLFSLLLTLYLVIPEAVFRTIFGWFVPPRNFVLSKTETAYRALGIAALPFALALFGTWYVPGMTGFPFPVGENSAALRRYDYRVVVQSLYSEAEFQSSRGEFWHAFTRCARRQARLILWYVLFIVLEASLAGKLARNFARYKTNHAYRWIADKILFPYISGWHPLLTPYSYVDQSTTVQADILCTNGMLYQGRVSQHFLKDGQLTGIFLQEPKRFDRDAYLQAKSTRQPAQTKDFWKEIPSDNLYFFVEKIVNMNLSYKPRQDADSRIIAKLIADVLKRPFSPGQIRVVKRRPPSKS
jgi:hypothetical protein